MSTKWVMSILGIVVALNVTTALAQRPLGIDTSVYCPLTQTEWNNIRASGIVFGWTRASYGWGGSDGELARHMTRAKAAGVIMGVYHFSYPGFSTGNTPTNEANTFINAAQPYLAGGYLKPVLDVEYNSGTHMTMTLSQWCVQFLNHFEQQTGVRPLIYSGQYFARDNLNSTVTAWPYWIAVWPANPNIQTGNPGMTTPWSTWTFWQYDGDVPIPGITTQKVDLNVFNGTLAGLQNYVIPGGSTPPSIAQHPASHTVATSESTTFYVVATGAVPLSYQWQKNAANLSNGGHYSNATTPTLTISNCDSNDTAGYRCVVTNAYGSATSNSATLTVGPPSTEFIVESRSGGRNYANYAEVGTWTDGASKSIASGTTPGIGHRWCTLGSAAVSATFAYTPSTGGTYEIFTTNCTTSNSGDPLIHKVVHSGGTANVGVCQNTTCGSNAVNNWYSLGQYVLNAGTPCSVTLDGSTGAGSAPASNAGRSDAIKWSLITAGGPTIAQHPSSQVVSPGTTAAFYVAATGSGTLTYIWQKNQTNLSNGGHYSGTATATLTISNADTNDSANYRCVVTDSTGSATSSEATLTVASCTPPILTNGNFEASTAGNPPSGWTTYIESSKSGNWTIQTSASPQGAQYQQTQVFNVSSFGGIRQNVTGLTSGVVYTISGSYRTNSLSATASVRYSLTGNADRANSTVLASTVSTDWGTFSGTVTATGASLMLFLDHANGTSSNKASAFDNITVSGCGTTPAPSITQHPVAQSVCPGTSASFTVAATGSGTLTYVWQKNGANLSGGGHYSGVSTATLAISGADSNDAANYRCVVSNVGGSATSDQAALTLKPTVAADLDGDCDVDQDDFNIFVACASGPTVPVSAGCESSDFDNDNDVDQSDFGILQRCQSGEDTDIDPGCGN